MIGVPAAEQGLTGFKVLDNSEREGVLSLTRNQALMALKKMKKGQKLTNPLLELLQKAGDEQDLEDPEYLDMMGHLRDCSLEMGQVVARMERFAAENTRG